MGRCCLVHVPRVPFLPSPRPRFLGLHGCGFWALLRFRERSVRLHRGLTRPSFREGCIRPLGQPRKISPKCGSHRSCLSSLLWCPQRLRRLSQCASWTGQSCLGLPAGLLCYTTMCNNTKEIDQRDNVPVCVLPHS